MSALVAVVLVVLSACGWPRDPDGTLDRLRAGGVVRVGVTANAPWTVLGSDGAVRGVEPALVREFATGLGAEVEWYPGSESVLMTALGERSLDVVIGGLDSSGPWEEHAALTASYVTTRTVVAVPVGSSYPSDFANVDVAVQGGTAQSAELVSVTAARALLVEDPRRHTGGPVVVDEWLVESLGLEPTGIQITSHDRIFATILGENGLLVALERFLLTKTEPELRELYLREIGAA